MRTLSFFVSLMLFAVLTISAQEITQPKKGAVLRMDSYSLELPGGANLNTDVFLIRSKVNQKTKFGGIQVQTSGGIVVGINADANHSDVYHLEIEVDDSVEPGKYFILLRGAGRNSHLIRGIIFSVVVGSDKDSVAKSL